MRNRVFSKQEHKPLKETKASARGMYIQEK
jgi:hypothetical protein